MVLTTVSTAVSNKVAVDITEEGVVLPGATNRTHFVGLYQNGVQVGTISEQGTYVIYNGERVIYCTVDNLHTFALNLYHSGLPNGDYTAVVKYLVSGSSSQGTAVYKYFDIPIRISVT